MMVCFLLMEEMIGKLFYKIMIKFDIISPKSDN